jgi:flagellar protein FlgJ
MPDMILPDLPAGSVRRALSPPPAGPDAALRQKAQDLEAAFLAEMLGHAGLGRPPETGGGGAGEAQFASFLRDAQAAALVRKGGIGLAKQIFEALKARGDDPG